MKKTLFFAAVTAILVLVSCQKESPVQSEAEPIVFTATIETPSETKVSFDMETGKGQFNSGDIIYVSNGTETRQYIGTISRGEATFSSADGNPFTEAGIYTATYGTMPTAGVDQAYSSIPGQMIHMSAPSVTVTTPSSIINFTFTADCGLLKLNLTASDKSIERIYVIDEDGNDYRLLCGTAQSIGTAKDFYIALPSGITITKYVIRDSEGYEAVKTVKSGKTGTVIAANQINKVTFSSLTFAAPVYPESNTAGTYVAGTWWAPVNCGYDATHTYGLLYQFGRKVGGGYDTTEGMQTATAATYTGGYNKNPDDSKFYYQASSPFDWYTNTASNRLSAWPMTSTDAGYVEGKIANPCPDGWRVPTYDELNALKANISSWTTNTVGGVSQSGYWFNGSSTASVGTGVFLPAAGSRNHSDGSAINRGFYGHYWSSSVNGVNGKNLRIYSTYARIYSEFRAYGHSVRCVQE